MLWSGPRSVESAQIRKNGARTNPGAGPWMGEKVSVLDERTGAVYSRTLWPPVFGTGLSTAADHPGWRRRPGGPALR